MQTLFDWFIAQDATGVPHVMARALWSNYATEFDWGEVTDVLEDIDTPSELAWRHFHNGYVWDKRSIGTDRWRAARAEKRAKDEARNAHVCALWLAATGLRTKDFELWRATSLNAVLHPQFGPSYTAATNGVDVLLVSGPYLSAEWMLVHRSNVIGPVTGSEVSVKDWNWVKNASAGCATGQGPKAPRKPSQKSRLEAILAEL